MEEIILISVSESKLKRIVEDAVRLALSDNAAKSSTSVPGKRAMTFEEGCEYAGISKSHGYKLTSQGRIPHSKRGKRIYFEKSELDEWLLSNKVKDVATLVQETDVYLQKKGGRYGK